MHDDDHSEQLVESLREEEQEDRFPLALFVVPRRRLSDLVFDEPMTRRLTSIVHRWRHREFVYRGWGLGAVAASEGLCVLFEGPPGTGKTAAASAIARETGQALYEVNLGGILSKYVGETEANLCRVLDEGVSRKVALLFDEGDVLFSKRVADPKDSGALGHNSVVGLILSRVARYPGLLFVTTNLGGALDAAMRQRFKVVVKFDLPEPRERLLIWEQALARVPVDFDGEVLLLAAERYKLSPREIISVVEQACFLAVEAGSEVTIDFLNRAILDVTDRSEHTFKPL